MPAKRIFQPIATQSSILTANRTIPRCTGAGIQLPNRPTIGHEGDTSKTAKRGSRGPEDV